MPAKASNLVAIAAGDNHNIGLLAAGRSSVVSQTSSRTRTIGNSMTIVAPSIGNSPATYQWQFQGINLPGATNAALLLQPLRWTNSGIYTVIISDAFGSITGPSVNVSLLAPVLQFDNSSLSFQMASNSFQASLLGPSGTGSLVIYS